MRLVRKYSRKKFFGKVLYEYERFSVPVPSRFREVVGRCFGRDLKVFLEPIEDGFAILVCGENRWVNGRPLSEAFRRLVQQLESGSGGRTEARENASEGRIDPRRSSSKTD